MRVGVLGVMEGAPGAGPVARYVRENVEVVDARWLREGVGLAKQGAGETKGGSEGVVGDA